MMMKNDDDKDDFDKDKNKDRYNIISIRILRFIIYDILCLYLVF